MLYATSQYSRQSLSLIRITLEAIASEKTVSNNLRQMVYDCITEAKILAHQHNYDAILSCSFHVESISLAVEIQRVTQLSEILESVNSKEILDHNFANRLLAYL